MYSGERLEAIWGLKPRPTIYGAIERLWRGLGDIEQLASEAVNGRISVIPGDLQLSELDARPRERGAAAEVLA